MKNTRAEIAQRLQGARDAAGLSIEATAQALNLEPDRYAAFESGAGDLPMGLLPELARLFGAEASAILTGGDAHARVFSITRKGHGAVVARQKAYHYENLAAGFSRPGMEPFMVTVDPKPDEAFHLNSHAGQEFDLVVHGRLALMIDGHTVELDPGDSIYFDASRPHGMRALDGKPAKFLAVIAACPPTP